MGRTRIAAATVMVTAGFLGAVAAPATAGKTHKLVGEFDGNPGSSVSMKVKLNDKGKPKFVKSFKFSGLPVSCAIPDPSDPNPTVIGEVPGKIRVKAGTKPPRYKKESSEAGVDISVSGELRKKGKLSTGEVSFQSGGSTGLDPCIGGPTPFEASKE
jgi:hypothetical protein